MRSRETLPRPLTALWPIEMTAATGWSSEGEGRGGGGPDSRSIMTSRSSSASRPRVAGDWHPTGGGGGSLEDAAGACVSLHQREQGSMGCRGRAAGGGGALPSPLETDRRLCMNGHLGNTHDPVCGWQTAHAGSCLNNHLGGRGSKCKQSHRRTGWPHSPLNRTTGSMHPATVCLPTFLHPNHRNASPARRPRWESTKCKTGTL